MMPVFLGRGGMVITSIPKNLLSAHCFASCPDLMHRDGEFMPRSILWDNSYFEAF